MLECVECGARSQSFELGWSAIRVKDPDEGGEPELVVYCARCFGREFGGLTLWLSPASPGAPATA